MKRNSSPYIRMSSIFLKSILILMIILFLPNMFIISTVFNRYDLNFDIDKYSVLINESIEINNGQIRLTDEGMSIFKNGDLWIQFVDDSLNEVYSYNKPEEIPKEYSPIEFIDYYKNDIYDSTVFIFEKEIDNVRYSYFIGIPRSIVNKYNILFNPKAVSSVIKNIIFIIIINLIIIIAFAYLYFSKRLVRPIQEIMDYIFLLSKGEYNFQADGDILYKEIFKCLNQLRDILKENKIKKELLDESREKWISYIGHDMKTPLSAIKGFAELLKDDTYSFSKDQTKEYSNIIYDKAIYMEELINDLNFSYKIKNSNIPLKLEEINLNIFLHELVEELVLNPKFTGKKITITSNSDNIMTMLDSQLIKRAFSNLIINFLIYNDKEATIELKLLKESDCIKVIMKDNGRGMSMEEATNIFEQYYRGTNTTANPNGSGLGMAIANELINLHNGKCSVQSEVGVGTTLQIILE